MIVTSHIIAMIEHWLNTEPNGYFGSDYGAPIESLFLRALNDASANAFLNKMKKDLPILGNLNSNQLSIYVSNQGFETKIIALKVGSVNINLSAINESRKSKEIIGETYDINAI